MVACGAALRADVGLRAAAAARRYGACRAAAVMSTRGDGLPCGSLVALITPMFADGSVDEDALRALYRWHIDCGTDGLVVLGTTGEASTLSPAERLNVLRITQEEAVGKLPVVIGTGAIQPAAAIKMGEEAAAHGANGVLVVTPYYVKPTQKGLIKYYEHIADNSPLPLVLYNVPSRTGVDMTPITVGALSQHPRIVGVKVCARHPAPRHRRFARRFSARAREWRAPHAAAHRGTAPRRAMPRRAGARACRKRPAM